MSKKPSELGFVDRMKKFVHAGISESLPPNRTSSDIDSLASLDERISFIFNIIRKPSRSASNMIFL